MYDIQNKGLTGKDFGVFYSKIILKLILNENLTNRALSKSRAFFCKIMALFFYFQKTAGKIPPFPILVARLAIFERLMYRNALFISGTHAF